MINYTERITLLMQDVVARTPRLSFIDLREILVFGRFGRSDAEGAFATCHCLTLPESEPGYFFWRDRTTGELTRRSQWFVTKSPEVRILQTKIKYLVSFALPRFCNQSLERSRKAELYPERTEPWVAKLDTIVHELYHIDPDETGLRRVTRADGSHSPRSHGPLYYETVAEMVQAYLASNPDPSLLAFLRDDFDTLGTRHREITCTTFRNFPSFPQRYQEAVDMPADPIVKIEPLKAPTQPVLYTEADLVVRHFTETGVRRLPAPGHHRAA
ncbi:MAG: hypothetical protein H0T05_05170 [Acidobacteria bacterium]|nr:hypothetical protein [Acidobacteriota bacterium]